MAVVSVKEMPRSGEFLFGESPELVRRFILTIDEPGSITNAAAAQAVGIDIGSKHPEYPKVPCVRVTITENYDDSPYHVEFIAQYGSTGESEQDATPNPLLRPSVWKFENFGQQTAALSYFGNDGNRYPLTNSAYDFFEGLTTDEAFTRVTITSNVRVFPINLAAAVTNRINQDLYLGQPPNTWKCQGVTAEEKRELVGDDFLAYWVVTVTLLYRESGWNLLLPDMGFNYIAGGQKRRVMTFDFENAEWIPSPVAMGLNGAGQQTFGAPAILNRRIYAYALFNARFGTPPIVNDPGSLV